MINIEEYVTLDEPIPYKQLKIYPVKMKDIYQFLAGYDILTINKNKVPDIEVIQMSYLQFVLTLMMLQDAWIDKFIKIMAVCFQLKPNEGFEEFESNKLLAQNLSNGDVIYFVNGWNVRFYQTQAGQVSLYVNDVHITAIEFDEVVKIILYQNINGYDDTPMSDDFRRAVEEYYKLKNKDMKPLTLEDKIDTVMSQTSYTKEAIMSMTYRRFERIFEKIVGKVEYVVGQMAAMQGCKINVEHWVYKKNKDKYSEAFTDMSAIKKL